MKLVFVFDHFGPYHEARVEAVAAAGMGEVMGVELHPRSRTYGWEPGVGRSGAFRKISLPRVELRGRAERRALRPHLERVLGECGPDVVFVNGWGDFMSLETIAWAKRMGVRLVVMSETRRVDGARSWWGEWVKSRIVGLCDAGLCGGESHRRYLVELGIPEECVALGYNVVNNEFFGKRREIGVRSLERGNDADLTTEDTECTEVEAGACLDEPSGASESDSLASELADSPVSESPPRFASGPASKLATSRSQPATAPEALPRPYFLASNRFIERKNLGRLIRAYARYCAGRAAQEIEDGRSKAEERKSEEKAETLKAESGKSPATSDSPLATSPIGEQCRWVWPLVLLGDGELRGELEGLCGSLGLRTIGGTTNHTKLHKNLTTDYTDEHGYQKNQHCDAQGTCAGTSESDSLASELADSPVSESLTRSASGPASLPATSRSLPATAPEALSLDLAAQGAVIFAGFRQVEELRDFYAGAGAFIHPALAEPWGLVINEAMACGLPVISSKNVGAAEELLREGVNGFLFDPEDVEELAGLIGRVAGMPPEERLAMGEASRRLIAEWGPERFARGAEEAARLALAGPAKRAGLFDLVLLEVLIRK